MSKIMEQLLNEEKIEAAKRMLERGKMTKEEIAEDLDLPLSVVESLENKQIHYYKIFFTKFVSLT